MTDLAVLVPSRGRPKNVARLAEACARTCRASTILHFGFDEDDPELGRNIAEAAGCRVTTGPRLGLAAWTNLLAAENLDAPYLGSLGDDMVPVTDGWDEKLITEVEHLGGGFAYPDDRRRIDIPEAVIVDTRIVRALGWLALPACEHWYIDDVWADLGRPERITFARDVIVEHRHPHVIGGDPHDQTYGDAAAHLAADTAAWQRWRIFGMPHDRQVVRQCLARQD